MTPKRVDFHSTAFKRVWLNLRECVGLLIHFWAVMGLAGRGISYRRTSFIGQTWLPSVTMIRKGWIEMKRHRIVWKRFRSDGVAVAAVQDATFSRSAPTTKWYLTINGLVGRSKKRTLDAKAGGCPCIGTRRIIAPVHSGWLVTTFRLQRLGLWT